MVFKDQNVSLQNPSFALDDGLFCDEHETDLEFGYGFCSFDQENPIMKLKDPIFTHFEQDLLWEEDELSNLLSNEKNTHLRVGDFIFDGSLMGFRKDSIDWMIRVSTHYGFVAMTTILAVNYFDRFLMTPCFQRDNKPWMSQLVAVACLSLASKVDEIQAPLLLDLQVEGSKFVFESKTIMRMELLVLSSLQWKMNPVTPLAYFDYFTRRLGLMNHHIHSEFLRRCEQIVVSVINDSRFLGFLPSVVASATMCLVSKEVDPGNAFDYQNKLKSILKISEETMNKCSKFILEVSDNHGASHSLSNKRNYHSVPGSPSGVIDVYLSSDNSNNSWAFASSVSSSPEPPLKKNRAQEQQMRLGRVSISVHGNHQ